MQMIHPPQMPHDISNVWLLEDNALADRELLATKNFKHQSTTILSLDSMCSVLCSHEPVNKHDLRANTVPTSNAFVDQLYNLNIGQAA
jgi:hypothetical protein